MSIGALLQEDVIKALEDHSYPVTFTRPSSGGSYDVNTGTVTGGSPDSETVYGVYTSRFTSRDQDGSLSRNNRVFLMKPIGVTKEPLDGDELTENGVTAKITSVRKVKSKDTIILYVCEVDT